jgi:hypothetical protein
MHKVFAFDRFALDLTRGLLRSVEQHIDLQPKSFAVLCHLVENAGRLRRPTPDQDRLSPGLFARRPSLSPRRAAFDAGLARTCSWRGGSIFDLTAT